MASSGAQPPNPQPRTPLTRYWIRHLIPLLASLALAAPAPAAIVDYLHVEANEGGSSGGHVALAFGDEVYHFQQGAEALLRLRRDRRAVFRTRYALLENRPVHVVSLDVPDAVAERARDAFARRVLREASDDARQAALAADVRLFELLAVPDGAPPGWPVAAAGYFLPAHGGAPRGHSPALRVLHDQVATRLGPHGLAERRAAVQAALAALPLEPVTPERVAGPDGSLFAPTTTTRLEELLAQRTALELLAAAPALRADALERTSLALTPAEDGALRAWMAATTEALAALPTSSRADWGRALLIGMARLAAAEASLADGHLAVLAAWPADAATPPLPPGAQRNAFLAALAAHDDRTLAQARAACLDAPTCSEAAYTRLESAVNRAAETRRAAGGAVLRVAPDPLLPLRPAARPLPAALSLPPAEAQARAATARAALAAWRAGRRAERGYALLDRNCVTELAAVANAGAPAAEEPLLPPPGAPWTAIPFVAAAALGDTPAVVARTSWPSWRQQARARHGGIAAQLAELTTLTAPSYRPGAEDSSFLFFTDELPAARPLFGLANLAFASGDAALGLLTWPGDGGRRLAAGARGVLFSLPELAFVNIRKGTTAWLTVAEAEP